MNVIDKTLLLKQCSLFKSLPLDVLLPIAEVMDKQTMDYGEKIFRHGDPTATQAYLIVEGQVELRTGDGVVLSTLKEGEFFGEEAIISRKMRGYEATCTLPTTLLTLSRTQLLQILGDCSVITKTLLTSYAAAQPYRERD